MFVSSAGRRPAASRIECSRNAVVVLPFVPVTAATSSVVATARRRSTAAAGPIAARTLGTIELRHVQVEPALDDERDRAALDRLRCEVVPVDARARGCRRRALPV